MAKKSKLPVKTQKQRARAAEILEKLYKQYPNPHCELNYSTPFQLLVATILSAQCTDVRVNIVTKELFRLYPDAASMAAAPIQELEELVKTTGFYRNKALSIKESAQRILDEFDGEVPKTMEGLLSLRGAARKTANVVLGNAFNVNEGVVVDTHVKRIAKRFGLTKHDNPVKVELDLMALFPREEWTNLSHLFIFHGRRACKARFKTPPDNQICKKFGKNCECQTR